jgi:hypothetical protein
MVKKLLIPALITVLLAAAVIVLIRTFWEGNPPSAQIVTGQSPRSVALSRSIVFPGGKKSYVGLLRGERAQKQYVGTGRGKPTQIEINQDLSTGDRAIVPEDVAMGDGLKARIEGQ